LANERKSFPSYVRLIVSFPIVENAANAPNNPININERASKEKIHWIQPIPRINL